MSSTKFLNDSKNTLKVCKFRSNLPQRQLPGTTQALTILKRKAIFHDILCAMVSKINLNSDEQIWCTTFDEVEVGSLEFR